MKDATLHTITNDVLAALDKIREKQPSFQLQEYGTVMSVGEGFVRVNGLPNCGTEELVLFEGGELGLVYNLDEQEVGVILLDEEKNIEAGDEVYRTDSVLNVPVDEQMLGRVLDPLGRPLDNKKPILANKKYPVERPAPPIMHRVQVEVPLQTGIKIIDALFPIGRGQRELILGDRQTGKTAIAVDTIINQSDKDVICIYCAVGKQKASIARVIADLRKFNAMDYSIVISASSEDPVGLQYIAPYAATSIAEFFMEQGRDVLIVYDDLTWHARAYRELALLLRRPPGREAYPGDIFYIHSRLLERSTRLKPEYGGGSLTALPIIETQAQNISAFIPTNLISITDGQLYLSQELFRKDILPAIDAGKSVSRVGSAAQLPAYRSVTKKLRLSYAQFEELESFSRFSSRLDEQTQAIIDRGRRIREVLKQPQFKPLNAEEQIIILLAETNGLLDKVLPAEIEKVQEKILLKVNESADLIQNIDWHRNLEEDDKEKLIELGESAINPTKTE